MSPAAHPGRPKRPKRRSDHFDSPWREAMHGFLRSFVEFFFPQAAADIAWEEGFEILDTELRQIAGRSRASPVRSDSLFRVRRRSGARQLVLIHGEVQTSRDHRLAERMFRYNYRSFDAQGLEVASFAILGDSSPSWRPDSYGWSLAIIFRNELDQLEAEKSMRYVTSVERLAKNEGYQEGLLTLLRKQLAQRFGQLPEWASQKLEAATPEALENWGGRIFAAASLEELFA